MLNTALDGDDQQHRRPGRRAQNDWWGLRTGTVTLPTPGPAVWPNASAPSATTTFNPPIPENPVNGNPVPDASCAGAGVSDSDSVTFCPYRSSDQSDTAQGEWPIAGRADRRATDLVVLHEQRPAASTRTSRRYDAFFNSTLGSGIDRRRAVRRDAVGQDRPRS